ncbi:hypothetical protein [Actinoalloteichus sp. GBA129-24]|uniref:hypothetical protein n=1 Tax=Actinoalloteichus sp. GBA129-24 TaxID=1612551 RepID=UPI00095099B6|nr:hypothetical protein [Actinoalloteichus sp. GBA129-24]APU21277.1 hypothetical protein UA75_16345 [Actinoalloteichus sp. GBA129-24]
MMTPAAGRGWAALDLVAEAIARVRSTDATDTEAALLAAWHGFATAEAAGWFLARNSLDDATLARNASHLMAAVADRLREAPSLPYLDPLAETVDGLIRSGFQIPVDNRAIVHHEPDQPADDSAAGIVRRAVLALALELNMLLPHTAEHADSPADRVACEHGTRLANELGRCWEGRLDSFLNSHRDLRTPGQPRHLPGTSTRRKHAMKRA